MEKERERDGCRVVDSKGRKRVCDFGLKMAKERSLYAQKHTQHTNHVGS